MLPRRFRRPADRLARGRRKALFFARPKPGRARPFTVSGVQPTNDYTGIPFNLGFLVDHYDLDLDYRVGPNRLKATAVLHIEVNAYIEGLTLDAKDQRKIYFVIDDDDEDTPSRIFHAEVSNEMLNGDADRPSDTLHHRM